LTATGRLRSKHRTSEEKIGDVGDSIGGLAGRIGTAGGYAAGTQAHDASIRLP